MPERFYFVDIIPGRILIDNHSARRGKYFRYVHKLLDLFKSGNIISGLKLSSLTELLTNLFVVRGPCWGLTQSSQVLLIKLSLVVTKYSTVYKAFPGGTLHNFSETFLQPLHARSFSYAGSFWLYNFSEIKTI